MTNMGISLANYGWFMIDYVKMRISSLFFTGYIVIPFNILGGIII